MTDGSVDLILRECLAEAGITLGPGDESYTLSDLAIDSLARLGMATLIQDRYGTDVEDRLTATMTVAELRGLIAEAVAAGAERSGAA
ncbi:phosphopantetheine-binding protein [Streptomyces sp. 4N124]|uniref:phosphopantetheine-binding protein n=1 Tax=Streptomyces sp. 4N124 TaxID=3457420 RepID=UPI003FD623A9